MTAAINQIKYLFARGFLAICAALPLGVVQALAAWVGSISSRLPTRARATTRVNLKLCFPDLDEKARARLARESLQETTKTAFEMGKSWLWPVERAVGLITEIQGKEIFEAARAEGKGVIILAPHLGNYEVLGQYIVMQGPTTFMYQPPKIPQFDSLIKASRQRGEGKVAPTSRQGVAQVLKALREGEMVGILPDQEPPEGSGEFAPFFGVPALTMTLVSGLVSRTGARVTAAIAKRLENGRGYRVIFKQVDGDIYSADIPRSLAALNAAVESCVREAVTQYQWEYKRFKRRPDGSRLYQ